MKVAEDYILQVRAGPSIDKLKIVNVNDEHNPEFIESADFTGYLVVRMLNFAGITPNEDMKPITNPQSSYFVGKNRRYSIMAQGRFKERFNGDDLVFGVEIDSPLRLPPGVQLALKISQWLDPALCADLAAQQPWMNSPFLTAMCAMAVYKPTDSEVTGIPPEFEVEVEDKTVAEKSSLGWLRTPSAFKFNNQVQPIMNNNTSNNNNSTPVSKPTHAETDSSNPAGKWAFHSRVVPEKNALLFENIDDPKLSSYDKRKKYFADPKNRSKVIISPDNVYAMDFYDSHFDFNTISIRLPGFSLNAFNYFDGQPVRFVAKSRDDKHVFFVVEFSLLEREFSGSDSENELDD
ncbi:hypothetical protein HK098_005692 [Nowakowskiella sp. JEL0407]|nr:hypothetical protein HK098_005692 [Nowakowskiella sp. JEL0407]